MAGNSEAFLSPQDVGRALLRHKRKSIGFFASTLVLVTVGVLVCPPKFGSEAKLFVRVGRESVSLDPTATTGQMITVHESRENEINSILEMLHSRAIAEKVVGALGANMVLKGVAEPKAESGLGMLLAPLRGALVQLKNKLTQPLPISDREKAISLLTKTVEVSTAKKSNVISVRCTADSPAQAQRIVNTWLDQYLEEHVRVNRTAGSHGFFVAQSQLLADQLQKANEQVRDAKTQMEIVSIDGKKGLLQSQIGAIESQLMTTEAALAAGRGKVADLQVSIDALPPRLVTVEVSVSNLAHDNMRQQLYQLQIRERELLSKYTAEHPQVVAIRQQVEDAQEILDEQPLTRTEATHAYNPTRQQLELNLLTEQSLIASLESQHQTLRDQRQVALDELKKLNENEVQLAQLQRQADLLATNYRAYADKLEQARIDEALETQRISNVNVVQPASFVSKPVSPKRGLILMLGMIVATFGAVAVAFLSESLDRSMKSAEDVERQLALPVLISIPRTANRRALLN
jgi:uncharacterized protein involved in exopolysaccharide biosynthesis